MSNLSFNLPSVETVMEILSQQDHADYPVDFAYAWKWIGYSTKASAKRVLLRDFVEGEDYEVFNNDVENPQGGRPTESVWLTADCFKAFAMMAGTEQGKLVRKYFIEAEKRLRETAIAPKSQPFDLSTLPPADVRVVQFTNALSMLGIEMNNPRYQQELKDFVLDKILREHRQLTEAKEHWCGLAELAEEMGYPIALVTKNRAMLGKFVRPLADEQGLEYKQEKRLCNGTQRSVNIYKDCEELRSVIREFMDAKTLASN